MSRIHDIFGDDTIAIREFFQCYLDMTTSLLEEIEQNINNKDNTAAKAAFHRLKGSSANSGVVRIQGLCQQAEDQILASDWESVQRIFHEIKTVFAQLKIELTEMIKS